MECRCGCDAITGEDSSPFLLDMDSPVFDYSSDNDDSFEMTNETLDNMDMNSQSGDSSADTDSDDSFELIEVSKNEVSIAHAKKGDNLETVKSPNTKSVNDLTEDSHSDDGSFEVITEASEILVSGRKTQKCYEHQKVSPKQTSASKSFAGSVFVHHSDSLSVDSCPDSYESSVVVHNTPENAFLVTESPRFCCSRFVSSNPIAYLESVPNTSVEKKDSTSVDRPNPNRDIPSRVADGKQVSTFQNVPEGYERLCIDLQGIVKGIELCSITEKDFITSEAKENIASQEERPNLVLKILFRAAEKKQVPVPQNDSSDNQEMHTDMKKVIKGIKSCSIIENESTSKVSDKNNRDNVTTPPVVNKKNVMTLGNYIDSFINSKYAKEAAPKNSVVNTPLDITENLKPSLDKKKYYNIKTPPVVNKKNVTTLGSCIDSTYANVSTPEISAEDKLYISSQRQSVGRYSGVAKRKKVLPVENVTAFNEGTGTDTSEKIKEDCRLNEQQVNEDITPGKRHNSSLESKGLELTAKDFIALMKEASGFKTSSNESLLLKELSIMNKSLFGVEKRKKVLPIKKVSALNEGISEKITEDCWLNELQLNDGGECPEKDFLSILEEVSDLEVFNKPSYYTRAFGENYKTRCDYRKSEVASAIVKDEKKAGVEESPPYRPFNLSVPPALPASVCTLRPDCRCYLKKSGSTVFVDKKRFGPQFFAHCLSVQPENAREQKGKTRKLSEEIKMRKKLAKELSEKCAKEKQDKKGFEFDYCKH